MSPEFQVEFQTTRKDYLEWNNFRLKKALKNKLTLLIIISILAGAFARDGHFDWVKSLLTLILFPAAMILFFYLLSNGILIYKLYRLTLGQDNYKDPRILTITDEGLIGTNSKTGNPNVFNWNRIASVYSTYNLVCIELSDRSTFVIPKRHFLPEDNERSFINAIESHLSKKVLWKKKEIISMQSKPSFWYKNKLILILGAAGVILSIAIYISMSSFFDNAFFKNGFAPFAQSDLNVLMKEVEFYKLQNGTYPDSLAQVYSKGEVPKYYDPTQSTNGHNGYNYQKIGNKYYLFSSGVDNIPHTADDIYPQMEPADTIKFGLILK